MIKKIRYLLLCYLAFFAIVGFVITCNITLILNLIQKETGIAYTIENIRFAAIVTFWNAAFISLVITVFDALRRKYLIYKPVDEILEITNKITRGNFNINFKPRKFSLFNKIGIDLTVMAEELSSIETLRTDFVSNVSHELKTPLAVLQNYGSLLEEPNLPEEKRLEYAKTINRVTKHLSELVTNILKLNKLESQKITPSLRKCNVSETLCECLITFESEWDIKNLEINADIEEDVYIRSDPEMLMIIWGNLFSNALKFTPEGGKINVNLKKNGNNVSVSVSDTGCGMDEKTMERIFDKFYQGDTSHSEKGNGLGLALVKRVIDMLGGEITVESAPGAGSTFTVKLKAD